MSAKEIKSAIKTITKPELRKLQNEGFSVRVQSNGLVFVGKKIEITKAPIGKVNYGILREDVYRLVSG